jgi:hypothetical protein
MLKRARGIWTVPGSEIENLVHECTIQSERLRLRTWYLQRAGINRPGNGDAGGNVFGEALSQRLSGMLLTPMGDIEIRWDEETMKDGAVHYLSTCCNGSAAPASLRLLEIDTMANLCPSDIRVTAEYPHWHHKQYVYIFDFITHLCKTTGIGFAPAVKIITDGDGSEGFSGSGVIIEARVGPLGFVGPFDHTDPGNHVEFRDTRKLLPDGSPNPDRRFFTLPPPKPTGWEFG